MKDRTFKVSTELVDGERSFFTKSDFQDYAPPESWLEIRIGRKILQDVLLLTDKNLQKLSINDLCAQAEQKGFLWKTEGGRIYDCL